MGSQSGNSSTRGGDLPEGVGEVVRRSSVPTFILEVPSETIVVASPGARALLSPDGREVVGENLESFTADTPTGALELLIAGRLSGYEAHRQLRRNDGSTRTLQFWARVIGEAAPPRHILVVVMADDRAAGAVPCPLPKSFDAVIGTTGVNLTIDRVSSDVRPLYGQEPEELIGKSIFEIVRTEDLAGLMWALAQATSERKGVSLHVRIKAAAGGARPSLMLLSPLVPVPSFAFAVLPTDESGDSPAVDLEMSLWQMRRGIDAVSSSRDLAGLIALEVPGLSDLSSRELEVVTMLLAGDRVPAIARSLFVAQSTVRNQLSSIFRKLGVGSQQELIDLLRAKKASNSR